MHPAPPVPPGIELTKPQRQTLASLGHHVARLAAAGEKLRAHAEKYPGLRPWLHSGPESHPTLTLGCGTFACPLALDQGRFLLHPIFATQGPPLAEAVLPPSAIPIFLNAPFWPALLRLRSLRDFWERELRRAALESWFQLLPDSWLLDPSPLPPGAVIPRLEISSWSEFNPAADGTHRFVPATAAEIREQLSGFPGAPGVLTALPRLSSAAQHFLSFYQYDGERIEWRGLQHGQPPAGKPD